MPSLYVSEFRQMTALLLREGVIGRGREGKVGRGEEGNGTERTTGSEGRVPDPHVHV